MSLLFNDIRGGVNLDAAAHAHGGRAFLLVGGEGPLGGFTLALRDSQFVVDSNLRDPEDPIYSLDVPLHHGADLAGFGWNLAHFQRACQRAEQSAPNRGDHVVESRRNFFFRLDSVKLLNGAVNTVTYRLLEILDVRVSDRSLDLFQPDAAGV